MNVSRSFQKLAFLEKTLTKYKKIRDDLLAHLFPDAIKTCDMTRVLVWVDFPKACYATQTEFRYFSRLFGYLCYGLGIGKMRRRHANR
jgi:hypothetical protein